MACYKCKGPVIGQATLLEAHTRSDGSVRDALVVPVCEKHAKVLEGKGHKIVHAKSTPDL